MQALYTERHSGITKKTPFPRFNATLLRQTLGQLGLVRHVPGGVAFRLRDAVDDSLQALSENPAHFEPETEFREWLTRVDYIRRNGHLRAGVAKVKITPPIPSLRWEGKPFKGVYRDLYARVVVLSHGAWQVALVLCDLLGISGELVTRIRGQIQERIGLPPEAIQIACTHSHSTPDTIGSGYQDQAYLTFMVDAITEAVCDAAANLGPARLGWGRVPCQQKNYISKQIMYFKERTFHLK